MMTESEQRPTPDISWAATTRGTTLVVCFNVLASFLYQRRYRFISKKVMLRYWPQPDKVRFISYSIGSKKFLFATSD